MKKQINLSGPYAGKLSLNKKTISNLNSPEMNRLIGGYTGWWCSHGTGCGGNKTKQCTQNQNTCPGHNTCYTCVTCV